MTHGGLSVVRFMTPILWLLPYRVISIVCVFFMYVPLYTWLFLYSFHRPIFLLFTSLLVSPKTDPPLQIDPEFLSSVKHCIFWLPVNSMSCPSSVPVHFLVLHKFLGTFQSSPTLDPTFPLFLPVNQTITSNNSVEIFLRTCKSILSVGVSDSLVTFTHSSLFSNLTWIFKLRPLIWPLITSSTSFCLV